MRHIIMDFITDPTENVFPMMMAGKGQTDMLLPSFCKARELA